MGTTGYYRLSPPPEFPGELERRGRKAAKKGECDEIGLRIVVYPVHLLMEYAHRMLPGRDSSKVNARDRWHEILFMTELIPLDVGDNNVYFHIFKKYFELQS